MENRNELKEKLKTKLEKLAERDEDLWIGVTKDLTHLHREQGYDGDVYLFMGNLITSITSSTGIPVDNYVAFLFNLKGLEEFRAFLYNYPSKDLIHSPNESLY